MTAPYRIGPHTDQKHYPVYGGNGGSADYLGYAMRWNKYWFAVEATTGIETRFPNSVKAPGKTAAAAYLAGRAAAGLITPTQAPPLVTPDVPTAAPLLHPRVQDTPDNRQLARERFAYVEARGLTPITGFPGTDNPWRLRRRCGAPVWLFWSHLRPQRGERATFRHKGCPICA